GVIVVQQLPLVGCHHPQAIVVLLETGVEVGQTLGGSFPTVLRTVGLALRRSLLRGLLPAAADDAVKGECLSALRQGHGDGDGAGLPHRGNGLISGGVGHGGDILCVSGGDQTEAAAGGGEGHVAVAGAYGLLLRGISVPGGLSILPVAGLLAGAILGGGLLI